MLYCIGGGRGGGGEGACRLGFSWALRPIGSLLGCVMEWWAAMVSRVVVVVAGVVLALPVHLKHQYNLNKVKKTFS